MSREIKEDLLEGFGNEGMDVRLIASTDWVYLEATESRPKGEENYSLY